MIDRHTEANYSKESEFQQEEEWLRRRELVGSLPVRALLCYTVKKGLEVGACVAGFINPVIRAGIMSESRRVRVAYNNRLPDKEKA